MNGIYRNEQMSVIRRNQEKIYSRRILSWDDATRTIYFRKGFLSDEMASTQVVSDGLYLQLRADGCADITIYNRSKTCTAIKIWGRTPEPFRPKEGEDIGRNDFPEDRGQK